MIKQRFLLITGGHTHGEEKWDSLRDQVFVLDVERNFWTELPSQFNLNKARSQHSSCTTNEKAFVYGGGDEDSMEFINLEELLLIDGASEEPKWTQIVLKPELSRQEALMAVASPTKIIVLGGYVG